MPTLDFKSALDASAEDVFDWHARAGAFERLVPPWMHVEVKRFDGIRDGDRLVFYLTLGPLRMKWVAEHRDYEEGRQFKDVQLKGPFRRWVHTHRMEPDPSEPEEASTLHDHLDYELPLGDLGGVAEAQVQRLIERQFAYRHRVLRQDLAMHRRYAPEHPLKVAVSGSHGLIGSHLVPLLRTGNHEIHRLVRSRPGDREQAIYWNLRTGEIDREKLEGLDAVIHLAGENIFTPRWTEEKKLRIYRSRVQGTELISETLATLDDPPGTLLTASGISYYGDQGGERLTEESAPGESGFLPAVCRAWEEATRPATEAGIRTVQLRTGVVLTPAGGALGLIQWPFRLGLGGTAGRKDQWFPWIALDDALGGYYHALMTDALEGPVNLTAPTPVTMETFANTLAGVLHRPAPFHVPPAVLRLLLGEAGDELVLSSARVLPRRLKTSGYAFCYPDLEGALRHQLGYESMSNV